MFDLFTGKVQHVPSTPAIPILVSTSIQGTALAAILVTSLVYATHGLPAVPDILAFVAEMPSTAPPPPPAAPAPSQHRVIASQAPAVSPQSAPFEAPARIEEEPATAAPAEQGVPGGVEGGISAGIVGGIPATIEGLTAPPPPPASQELARVGGQIHAPALLKRVEPIYPQIAQLAGIDGIVILEAVIDEHGRVRSVKVLRGSALLAKAATDAVEQWIYEPLRLNGVPTAFELAVSLNFHFDNRRKLGV